MRIIVPLALVAAGFAGLSTYAVARSLKPAASCTAVATSVAEEVTCTASERLCENWLKGRAAYRAKFPGAVQPCG